MSRWSVFGNLAKLLVPALVAAVNPKLAPLGTTIADGIATAQGMPGLSGSEKLAHVQALAHEAAVGINQATGKNTVPIEGLDAATAHVINVAIQVVNDVHPKVVTPLVSSASDI